MGDFVRRNSLGDFVDLVRGNTYQSSLLGLPGPVLLGLGSIARNGGFKSGNLKTYGGVSDPRLLLYPGDIYVSLKDVTQSADLLGAVARVPPSIEAGRLTQDTVKLQFKSKSAPRDYLYWILRTPQYRSYCKGHATGTTNLGLPREDFLAFEVPPLSPERRILVDLLQSLDDKIELNRRMNETLEAMARALFQDWFVDFGPVRAKMDGRAPYLAPDLWDLFPERLDAEGKPEGWEVKRVGDLVDFNPREPLSTGTMAAYLDMGALPTRGPNTEAPVMREYTSGMRFRNGDALLARITPCLENGKAAFIQNLPESHIGWGSTEFIVMRSRKPLPAACAYLLARDPAFKQHAMQSMTGTSGRQRVQLESLLEFELCVPLEDELLLQLGEICGSSFDRIAVNDLESRTLAQTRDLLLPKLMSGEIRVKDAEKITAAAGA